MRISELSRMISPSTANHRPLQSTASPVATTTTPAAAPALGTIPTSSRPSSRLQSPGTSSPFFHAVPAVRRHPARQLLRRSRPVLYCGIALLSRQGSCASDTAFPFLFLRELQAVFLNAVYCLSAHPWSPLHLDCMDLRPHFCALQFTLSCIVHWQIGRFQLASLQLQLLWRTGVSSATSWWLGSLATPGSHHLLAHPPGPSLWRKHLRWCFFFCFFHWLASCSFGLLLLRALFSDWCSLNRLFWLDGLPLWLATYSTSLAWRASSRWTATQEPTSSSASSASTSSSPLRA